MDDYFDLEEEELIRELKEFLKEKQVDFSNKEEQKVFEFRREVYDDHENTIDELRYKQLEEINEEGTQDELDSYKLCLNDKYKVLSSKLSSKEEIELFKRFEQGDEKAKERIILSNLKLVHFVAKKYRGKGIDYLDLVQEGYIGLIKAVERFDWRRGCKFSTYATWWIKQAISRALVDKGSLIRIPVHLYERMVYIKKISEAFKEKYGIEPTLKELSEYTGISLEELKELEGYKFKFFPLEVPLNELSVEEMEELSMYYEYVDGENNYNLQDLIEDYSVFEEIVEQKFIREKLKEVLDSLSEREKEVLILRYGLEDNIPRTLDEVGKIFNVTRERIRQIEAKALRKLRHLIRSKNIEDYLEGED